MTERTHSREDDALHRLELKEAEKQYRAKGWRTVPLARGEKRPKHKDWQVKDERLMPWHHGIGVQFGQPSGGLSDVDVDCEEARDLAPHFLPPTGAVFGRQSAPGSHWLYYSDAWEHTQRAITAYKDVRPTNGGGEPHGVCLVELRTGRVDKDGTVIGAMSVFPPSIHLSGERVEWERDGEPGWVDDMELRAAVALLATATLLVRHYPSVGNRNEAFLVLGGWLARGGLNEKQIRQFVEAIAEVAGDEEGANRVEAAASAVKKLAIGQPMPGIPRMKQVFGADVVNRLMEWLDPDECWGQEETEPGAAPELSEDAIALAFAATHETGMRYVALWSRWLRWDAICWRPDQTLAAFDAARATCRTIATGCNNHKAAKAIASAKTVAAVERLAKSDRRLAATHEQWDGDHDVLGTPGGSQ